MSAKHSISAVVPVYRSGNHLDALYSRLSKALELVASDWEIVLVDDASNDGTFEVMRSLHVQDHRVKAIRFARNMGQHHATLCGMRHASKELVLTLDDDLQYAPEEIPKFIEKIELGHDLVIGRIPSDKKHSNIRNLASRTMRRLTETVIGKPQGIALSSFRCMTRKAAVAITAYQGTQTYLPALMFDAVPVDRIANADINHRERIAGQSTYSLRKLLKLSSYLIINHSSIPLRITAAWGLFVSFASLMYALSVIIRALFFSSVATGWPSLAVLISFLSGNILLCLGVVGEYVARILSVESRARQFPIFEKLD